MEEQTAVTRSLDTHERVLRARTLRLARCQRKVLKEKPSSKRLGEFKKRYGSLIRVFASPLLESWFLSEIKFTRIWILYNERIENIVSTNIWA